MNLFENLQIMKEYDNVKPNISEMTPKRQKMWNAIDNSNIPEEDKVAFFNVWISRLPLGSQLSYKIRQAINHEFDTWSSAAESEDSKIAEVLYSSVSKNTLDKYRDKTVITSKEKSEIKKQLKIDINPVISEIMEYLTSKGIIIDESRFSVNYYVNDYKKGICTIFYSCSNVDIEFFIKCENEIEDNLLSIVNDNGFTIYKGNDIFIIRKRYNYITINLNCQKQY